MDEVIDFLFQIEMADSVEQQGRRAHHLLMELAQRGGVGAAEQQDRLDRRRLDLRGIGAQAFDQLEVVPRLGCFMGQAPATRLITEQRRRIAARIGGMCQLPLLAIGSTPDRMEVIVKLQVMLLRVPIQTLCVGDKMPGQRFGMAVRREVGVPQAPAFVAHPHFYQACGKARRLDGAGRRRREGGVVHHIQQVVDGFVTVATAPGRKAFVHRVDQLSGADHQQHFAHDRNE